MLANGAKLEFREKTTPESSWTNLPGLKEIPDLGAEPEKVENTVLTDELKKYEMGIGDPGDMEYVFKYENKADSAYRLMRPFEKNRTVLQFKETTFDGTTTEFEGTVSCRRNGGGVNDAIEFTLGIALASDLDITDPV